MTIYVKTVLGQNPDLHMVRTNQDVHIYLGTTLPSNNTVVCKSSSTELLFTSQLEYWLFRLVMNCMYWQTRLELSHVKCLEKVLKENHTWSELVGGLN